MRNLQLILICVIGIVHQIWSIQACTTVSGTNSSISYSERIQHYQTLRKCWRIQAMPNKFIRLKVENLNLGGQVFSCENVYLRVAIFATKENYTFCPSDVYRNPVTSLTDATVEVYFRNQNRNYYTLNFNLRFDHRDFECARENSFHCTELNCIPASQVCDGFKNCENGADELNCKTGVLSVPGVREARNRAISWLKNRRTLSWGWNENTPRVVTSLYLAGGANFNGTSLEEELMAKQTELKTAVALLRNVTYEQLSTFINALLVTCHNPRYFHGQNLIRNLKNQVGDRTTMFVHPIAYLTLCNANETWPSRAYMDLNNTLNSTSEYHFVKDIQAFALMALSCGKNNSNVLKSNPFSYFTDLYQRIIKRFKDHQMPDGSFGNIHTTALVTQALIASGQDHARDWKLNSTINYLIKELNSSDVEFFAMYLALPVLNGKSLADVARTNCSSNPRMHRKVDLASEVRDYTGPKMQVQYSLYIGNEKDVIHTITLRVPQKFTAFDVMQLAEIEDPKYKFEWKRISDKIYVYKIGKVTNDPESGQFWILNMEITSNSTKIFEQSLPQSPENLHLKDSDHIIMWYRSTYSEI